MLESIARIRSLGIADAALHPQADVTGVVIFYDRARNDVILNDGQDGIYVGLSDELKVRPVFGPGSRVRVEGRVEPGGFLPLVLCSKLTVLGQDSLPAAKRVAESDLFSPALDCQWVEMPAIVTGYESGGRYGTLTLEVGGWRTKAQLPGASDAEEKARRIMQRPVLVRGALGTVFNDQRQLTDRYFFVPSFDEIIPTDSEGNSAPPELRPINELLRSDVSSGSRVRVRGEVTYANGSELYLRGDNTSLAVSAYHSGEFVPGDRVEAEGFAAAAPFRPKLRATKLIRLGRGPEPLPRLLDLTSGEFARQEAELVTVDADLLSSREGVNGETVLKCRTEKWLIAAVAPPNIRLPVFAAGDRLRLTGICGFTTTRPLPWDYWVDGLRLRVRGAGDIAVIHRGPWWTLPRLLWALGLAGGLALAALAWAALLRRRVSVQTQIIGAQIEREAVTDERQRIARELHDTIEQNLAGLAVQLRNAKQRLLKHSPEQAEAAIALAQGMLRHCREETHASIYDLRSVLLEQKGLQGALEELLPALVSRSQISLSIDGEGKPRSLDGPSEIHLFRIAQQAVANAVQHSGASKIGVRLVYSETELVLEIGDDGRGFDPKSSLAPTCFGIRGINERANKLHAAAVFESAPGSGACVRVTTPLVPRGAAL